MQVSECRPALSAIRVDIRRVDRRPRTQDLCNLFPRPGQGRRGQNGLTGLGGGTSTRSRGTLTLAKWTRPSTGHCLFIMGVLTKGQRRPSAFIILAGVIGISVTRAPSGRIASFTALRTAPTEPEAPASPAPFAPGLYGPRRFDMLDDDVGQIGGSRQEVVGKRSVGELAFLRVNEFLVERLTDTLCDTSAHLLRQQQRVDHDSEIVDCPVFQQSNEAGAVSTSARHAWMPLVGTNEGQSCPRCIARGRS